MAENRIEKDSLGEVKIPSGALYGAQTQRAIENFPVSGIRFPRIFIRSLGLIKGAAADVNAELGLLDTDIAEAIRLASDEVAEGRWDDHFPLDIFQTGSGTSTNMNANEVIANRSSIILGGNAGSRTVHPNDHVNMGQSSNDVIPTAIHLSASLQVTELLLPSLVHLKETLQGRAEKLKGIVKTGRTHLMDAMPVSLGQEIGGWAFQVEQCIERITETCFSRLSMLAIGGTAVGTGVNAHPEFGQRVSFKIAESTGLPFTEAGNHFAAQSSMDNALELSGQLKTAASAITKIANDLRLMNSGPLAGFAEISLDALQPGSSIMPGKINPVICESAMMACAQVTGNDAALTMGNSRGEFELNIMLPLIAHSLLQSITLLGNSSRLLADKAVAGFSVNRGKIEEVLGRNPVLITSLTGMIGYDEAARIAKRAYAEGRSIREVAAEMTDLPSEDLNRLLDPRSMTGAESGQKSSDGPN